MTGFVVGIKVKNFLSSSSFFILTQRTFIGRFKMIKLSVQKTINKMLEQSPNLP